LFPKKKYSMKRRGKIKPTRGDGIAEVNVALGRQVDQTLKVVGLLHGVGLPPVSSVLAVILGSVQVAVHAPSL
jgi:hypothetical protein